MQPGARVAAAIEVLADMMERHRTAASALSDWGKAHRFAGSGDRSAIGTLVYDALRRRASSAHMMESDAPRALVLGALHQVWKLDTDAIGRLMSGPPHGDEPLDEAEKARLSAGLSDAAPAWVQGDYPEWLHASIARAFGDEAAAEGAALATRAPIDVRVNGLKATREKVLKALDSYGAVEIDAVPLGVRILAPTGGTKAPNIEAEGAHGKGWFEVQDAGSQIAALMAGAGPRLQVMDLCAGAGGKTLAFAAAMQNTGQIYAYDSDKQQLRPIFERLKRAGARNVQVMDAGDSAALEKLDARFDVVFADAPCTGSGTWRRRPDAKWRLTEENLQTRLADQKAVLAAGARLVKPGGRFVYVTCSVLPEENSDQVDAFLADHPDFRAVPYADLAAALASATPIASAIAGANWLQLSPRQHGTDGFFIAVMTRVA